MRPHRVLHFEFPDDEHLVVMAGDHDDTEAFLDAIGDRAIEVPPP